MDRPVIPADLSALSADELATLGNEIRSYMKHLRGQEVSADLVTELTSVREDYNAVQARAAEIVDEQAELAAAVDELAGDLGDDDDAGEGGDDAADADGDDAEQAAAETEGAADDAAAAEAEEGKDGKGEQAASKRNALAELNANRRASASKTAAAPVPQPTADTVAAGTGLFAATNLPHGLNEGHQFDSPQQFAAAIVDYRNRLGRTAMRGRSFAHIATASTLPEGATEGRLQSGDHEHNFAMLDGLTGSRRLEETLLASGVLCPPDNPFYDFFRLAEPQAPVEGALPVVAAPRGSLRYIRTPDFRAARAAIGTRTADENADPDTPDKPCARVTCPDVLEDSVTAVSECVLFDNLGYRAFPELVQNFMADVAVNFAAVKECLYLSVIDDESTQTTVSQPVYGAARAFFFHLRQAASAYRKRHNMRRGAALQGYFPSWLPDLLCSDMANDHALGIANLGVSEAMFAQIFANLNVSPVWFNDQANCHPTNAALDWQAWRPAQAGGALNEYPTAAKWYLHAPGTFVRMDSGSLDVGVVRDSILNGTNDLEIFMEQWVGVIRLGIESVAITSTLCANGTAPNAVEEMACTGS